MSKFITFFAIIAIIYEGLSLFMPVKFNNLTKGLKEKPIKERTSLQSSYLTLNFFYWIWCFLGLLTSEWLLFIILLIVNVVLNIRTPAVRFVRSFIALIILLSILINCYHLNINVYQLILSTISKY